MGVAQDAAALASEAELEREKSRRKEEMAKLPFAGVAAVRAAFPRSQLLSALFGESDAAAGGDGAAPLGPAESCPSLSLHGPGEIVQLGETDSRSDLSLEVRLLRLEGDGMKFFARNGALEYFRDSVLPRLLAAKQCAPPQPLTTRGGRHCEGETQPKAAVSACGGSEEAAMASATLDVAPRDAWADAIERECTALEEAMYAMPEVSGGLPALFAAALVNQRGALGVDDECVEERLHVPPVRNSGVVCENLD